MSPRRPAPPQQHKRRVALPELDATPAPGTVGGGRGRGRFVPDHKKNPNKWTKYSLADVDLVTDRGNTAAALDFLKDLR